MRESRGELGQQADIGRLYMERQRTERELISLNRDIMSGKKEINDEEVDELFREYNRLGRLIADAEKAEPGKGA